MAEMTPDYEIGDDVMYASDQRSVGIPAKVLALTAPNGNLNYLQIKTAPYSLALSIQILTRERESESLIVPTPR